MSLTRWIAGAMVLGLLAGRAGAAEDGPAAVTVSAAMPALGMGAGTPGQATLMDCFKEALVRSETLATQAELIVQAQERYRQAWGSLAPTVAGYGDFFHQETSQLTAAQVAGDPADQSTVRLGLDQPLFRGFREYAALDQAKAGVVYQKESKQWAGLQLYQDVASAFYAVLAVQKDLQTVDGEVQLYEQRIADLKQRISIGRSRETEVLTVQSAQAILKAQADQLHGQLDAAQDILAFLTGVQHDALTETAEVVDQAESMESYLGNLDQRPDLQAAQKTVDMARSGVDIAKGGHWPSVDLLGDYYFARPSGSASQNIPWDATIELTVPIFQGGVVSSQARAAESQVKQAELSYSLMKRTAEEDLRTDYHNLRSDLRQNASLQTALSLAEKNYKAEMQDYNYGLVTNLDVLDALSAYEDTQRSLDKARYATYTDFSALEAVSARRLDLVGGN
jgi:outer membrane protein